MINRFVTAHASSVYAEIKGPKGNLLLMLVRYFQSLLSISASFSLFPVKFKSLYICFSCLAEDSVDILCYGMHCP